jgi:hypothetical protein
MTLLQMIDLLSADLRNEWKHLRFYLYHASALSGLHAEEYKEVFLKEAASEMGHVTEFSDLIWGLGGTPTADSHDFPCFQDVRSALEYALAMETEVVKNYVERIEQAETLPNPEGRWITIFLEDQINHSRRDVDRFRRLLANP